MSGDGGEVILFPKARDDSVQPTIEKDAKPRYQFRKDDPCAHKGPVRLDEAARRLYCSACDRELDIFDWMWDFVGRWERENTSYRQAKQQAAQAQEELDKLERKVKNRRAAARRPGVLLTAGDARRIRDAFRTLQAVVLTITRDREDALRQAHLHGWNPEGVAEAYRRLSDAVELRDRPEATSA